jgi:hypothetical protein
MNNVGGILKERVMTKLTVEHPAALLIPIYLEQICEKYGVDWSPTYRLSAEERGEPMKPLTGRGKTFSAHKGMIVNGEDNIPFDGGVSLPPALAPVVSVEQILVQVERMFMWNQTFTFLQLQDLL